MHGTVDKYYHFLHIAAPALFDAGGIKSPIPAPATAPAPLPPLEIYPPAAPDKPPYTAPGAFINPSGSI